MSILCDVGILHVCDYNFEGKVVNLPNQGDSQTFSELFVTGFGVPNYNSNDYSDDLDWATVTVQDLSVCKNKFNSLNQHSDASLICTKGSSGVCWGDEGAGLLTVNSDCKVEQRGVAGSITSKCASNHPQYHANVANFVDWINDQMGSSSKCENSQPSTTTTTTQTSSTTAQGSSTTTTTTQPPSGSDTFVQIPGVNCGNPMSVSHLKNPNARVVGGHKIDIADFPWNAVLFINGNADCGGSVISPEWILTVGHCTNGLKTNKAKIVVGVSNYQGATQLPVSEIITHPDYHDPTTKNDIGLIKLATPLDIINSNVRPICLPRKDMCLSSSESAWITGWGATKANGSDSPKDLHGAEIPIVTSAYCTQKYGNEYFQASMTCAADGTGTDGCDGDSGSPLSHIHNGYHTIWGMNSWSNVPCAKNGYPGVYNRVAAFTQFIYDNTGVRLENMGEEPSSVCDETVTKNLN